LPRLTFISDLHLPPGPGQRLNLFKALLAELASRQESGRPQELYVVGDLLSFWVDRKAVAALFGEVLRPMAELSGRGCRITLLDGNRDFGFGPVMTEAAKVRLVGERTVVEHAGSRALLLHGDQLLTSDRRYQFFKALVRSWPARLAARLLPSPLLLWAVRRLERVSTKEKARKSAEAMLVDQAAASRALADCGGNLLIHGHTHQPTVGELTVSTGTARVFNLGEWSENGAQIVDWPEDAEPRLVHWPPEKPQE
jgi:UDP-2,3-diacylglucosamine hydrolase